MFNWYSSEKSLSVRICMNATQIPGTNQYAVGKGQGEKDSQLTVRISSEDKQLLKEAAQKQGMTLSNWLLSVAIEAASPGDERSLLSCFKNCDRRSRPLGKGQQSRTVGRGWRWQNRFDYRNDPQHGVWLGNKYSDRGIRKILAKYAALAGLDKSISPHQLRHFLLTWLKKQGIDDALIPPYSGHSSRQSKEVYSRLSIGEAQEVYDQVMDKFPV
jgi:integrase/recombinase XerD